MARRVRDVNGCAIGILANGRDNAELLARETAQYYVDRHECTVADVPSSTEGLQGLSDLCDFVIAAIGDSEESADRIIRDGIALERLGTPVLVVCTKPYRDLVDRTAMELGIFEYPLIAVDHPVEGIAGPEIADRALRAYQQGMATLTGVYLIRG